MTSRLILGFLSGALSHVIFQGALGAAFFATGMIPRLVWSLTPVPPFGVPVTVNNMFWDGLWGMVYALAEPRLTARFGRLPGGVLFGFAPLIVYWFVVLPLKGAGLGEGDFAAEILIDIAFDTVFGLGIAIFFAAGLRLTRRPASAARGTG
jgi:hypothetical protein